MRPIDPRLREELPGFQKYLVTLGVLGALTAVAILVQAELLAALLTGPATGTAALLGGAILGRAALTWAASAIADRYTTKVKATLRKRVLARSLHTRDAGSAATLVTRGIDGVHGYFAEYLPKLVGSVVIPLAVLARLLTADLVAGLTVAVTLPLIPVFAALVGAHTRARTERQWRLLSTLGGHFLDVVTGLPTLKVFGRAQAQAETVRKMADAHASATMRTLRVAFLSALVLELVATLSVALVAVPVGLRLLDGGLDAQTALVILLLAPEAYLPLRAAGAKFHASAEGLAVLEEVRTLPRAQPEGSERATMGEVRFEGVTVRYPDRDHNVLSNVDLTIRAGERLVLVGPSGSGKSTLLAVLLGFVRPTAGRVLVDGVDLRELDLTAWRAQLAWVPQRPTMFPGSLADNISLGADGDVEAAAEAAGIDFSRATGISSGQRQRVGLARAFLRPRAGLLLLDEPTAHLDTTTEAAILRTAAKLAEGRTAVLVAHRPAMTALATRVVELRHGKLQENA
ncbi:thiol reductant ABC exporter subunit CydD [Amycolatopsis magusensis]|uniref:thiol reductant ABC exporter subunit CydD n=1 Tax=Amycolatopsis magusensis TaxID=882444 RepID=UPI0024A9C7CF|nr:thiol reductant ABC exporter subunit CydD [Amycolatopsis magusensis]MDI5977434.1 thiol reductant ABC exporter subunit CydD [Amycolatopsis magusensis]